MNCHTCHQPGIIEFKKGRGKKIAPTEQKGSTHGVTADLLNLKKIYTKEKNDDDDGNEGKYCACENKASRRRFDSCSHS